MTGLKRKVAQGTAWVLLERLVAQGVTFGVEIILARLLTPEDYGTVSLLGIFFSIAGILAGGGLPSALIQKIDADSLDYNSVFYVNVVLACVLYGLLFLAAPLIAGFYHTPQLVQITRVAGVSLIVNALSSVQDADLTRKMKFNLSFRISLVASIVSAISGVTLAYMGFGVWALIYSTLLAGFAGCVAKWLFVGWRPRWIYSVQRVKRLYSYGWKMAAATMIDQIFVNLNGLLIGRFYSKSDLAFVNKGRSLPSLAMNSVDGTLGRVSYPAFVFLQNDVARLGIAARKMLRCSTFLVFPLMVGLATCAQSILLLLYGKQWVSAAPYMMLYCFSFAVLPFSTINLRILSASGRSDIFLVLEILKKVVLLISMLISLKYGVLVFVAVSVFVAGPLALVINTWPSKRLISYPLRKQLGDVVPILLICFVQAIVMIAIGILYDFMLQRTGYKTEHLTTFLIALKIFVQLLPGYLVFFGLSIACRLEPLKDCFEELVRLIGDKKNRFVGFLFRRFYL